MVDLRRSALRKLVDECQLELGNVDVAERKRGTFIEIRNDYSKRVINIR